MRACKRGAPPDVLTPSRVKKWTDSWLRKREKWRAQKAQGRSARAPKFAWPQHQKRPLNQHLLPHLKAMTQRHCAYCDAVWVEGVSKDTIDHFRPKSDPRWEDQVVEWTNLFYACDRCQEQKGEHYDDALLKPDDPKYGFERFFVYQPDSGKLKPSPAASPAEQHAAACTIELFGLNKAGRPRTRKWWFERFCKKAEDPDSLPYRFLFE